MRKRETIPAWLAVRLRGWMRYAMRERGVSQREFAKSIGDDEGNISKMLSGKRLPTLRVFMGLHEHYSLRLEHLYYKDPEDFPVGQKSGLRG